MLLRSAPTRDDAPVARGRCRQRRRCGSPTGGQLLRLAARDLTGNARGRRDVAAELADLAGATLEAALAIARAERGRGGGDLPAGGHRDGQVRRPRAQLRQRRRRGLRRRAGRRAPTRPAALTTATRLAAAMMRVCSATTGEGTHLAGRRRAAAGGQGRPAGAHAGQPRRLLRAVGARPGSSRRCSRPGRSPATSRSARRTSTRVAPLVWQAADRDRTSSPTCRRCAAGSRSTLPAAASRPPAQARPGRPARRRVRRAAAAARARPQRRHAAQPATPWRRWRRCRPTATSGATTPPSSTAPTASCARSSTGCSCTGCAAPT